MRNWNVSLKSSFKVAGMLEVPPVAALPNFLVQSKVCMYREIKAIVHSLFN